MAFTDATSLAIESWTLYAVAVLIVVARLSVTYANLHAGPGSGQNLLTTL